MYMTWRRDLYVVKKIPFTSYDLASDETAKRLWKRKAPLDKQQLPGILVGGKFPGIFEFDELDKFLRLKETWDPEVDHIIEPPVQPIGVPGAALPLQMTPDHIRKLAVKRNPSPSPNQIPVNKRTGDFDVSEELSGYGLQGVRVTEDELAALVKELGLEGEDAGNLVKGLSTESDKTESAGKPQSRQSASKEAKLKAKVQEGETGDSKAAADTQQSQGMESGAKVTEEKTEVEDAAVTTK
ncbi:hypothetical protein MPER_09504 [Moniliophthora perniciosa FA553]|nr:hypothetical protein MPER_09504 [Moniliophthora perniciosa FA553]